MRTILATLAIVLALLAATSSRANVFSTTDPLAVASLMQKMVSIATDIQAAAKASTLAASECYNQFVEGVLRVYTHSGMLLTLVGLELGMVNSFDDLQLIDAVRQQIKKFRTSIDIERGDVNRWMALSMCSSNMAVTIKGQEVLKTFDLVASQLDAMSKKLGPTPN
jgi:hypothetical protein